jgi:hypothetical protein
MTRDDQDMDESAIVTVRPTTLAPAQVDDTAADEARWAGFDRWSSNLFLLLAILTFVVLLTVGGLAGGSDIPMDVVVITLAFAAVQVVLLVIASIGLDRHRAWARTTARWILWIMILTGVGGALVDLLGQKFTIPLGAIAAIVVLRRQPGPTPVLGGRDSWIAIGIGGLLLAATVVIELPVWVAAR